MARNVSMFMDRGRHVYDQSASVEHTGCTRLSSENAGTLDVRTNSNGELHN